MKFTLNTNGDPLKPDAAVDVIAKSTITGLTIKGTGQFVPCAEGSVGQCGF